MSSLFGFKKVDNDRILMLGLDDVGKTAILYRLLLEVTISVIPTVSFNVETIKLTEVCLPMDIWDVGGQRVMRRLWVHYLQPPLHGLVYVVDGSVSLTNQESEEFRNLVSIDEIKYVPILVLINKEDLPSARTSDEIIESLGLFSLPDRLWHVQRCSAVTGEGIREGFMEISRMAAYFRKLRSK